MERCNRVKVKAACDGAVESFNRSSENIIYYTSAENTIKDIAPFTLFTDKIAIINNVIRVTNNGIIVDHFAEPLNTLKEASDTQVLSFATTRPAS